MLKHRHGKLAAGQCFSGRSWWQGGCSARSQSRPGPHSPVNNLLGAGLLWGLLQRGWLKTAQPASLGASFPLLGSCNAHDGDYLSIWLLTYLQASGLSWHLAYIGSRKIARNATRETSASF